MEQLIFADSSFINVSEFEKIPPECFNATRKGREILANHPQALTVRERQFLHLLNSQCNEVSPILTELSQKVSIGDMLAFGLIEVNTICKSYNQYQKIVQKSTRAMAKTRSDNLNDPILKILEQN